MAERPAGSEDAAQGGGLVDAELTARAGEPRHHLGRQGGRSAADRGGTEFVLPC